jgi:hypothetical protein
VPEQTKVDRFLSLVRRVHAGSTPRSENDLSSRLAGVFEEFGLHAVVDTTPDGGIEAKVRYAGAQDLYTVSGSPVLAPVLSARPDQVEHRAAHERILETLTTPGRVESGNEVPVELLDG